MKRYKLNMPSKNKEEEVAPLPPRSTIHRTDRTKFTRWFYRILAFCFIALTISLLLWGFLALNE